MDTEIILDALKSIGIDTDEVQLQNVKDDSLTLRYRYWKWLPEGKETELKDKLGEEYKITPDTYTDDDRETDEGRPIFRYLHSYIIKKV